MLFSSEYLQTNTTERGFEFEPGLIYGISDRWSAEIHTHHELFHRKFSSEVIGLETVYRFLGPVENVRNNNHKEPAHLSDFSLAMLFEFEKGINESPNGLEGRFIGGADIHLFSLVTNLIAERILQQAGEFEFRYALGMKYELFSSISFGVEADGKLTNFLNSHVTPGIYASISRILDLRAGASFPLGSQDKSLSVRTTVIYSF